MPIASSFFFLCARGSFAKRRVFSVGWSALTSKRSIELCLSIIDIVGYLSLSFVKGKRNCASAPVGVVVSASTDQNTRAAAAAFARERERERERDYSLVESRATKKDKTKEEEEAPRG